MTATERGWRSVRTLSAAASRSRTSAAARERSVSSVGKERWTTPASSELVTTKPLRAKTCSIRLFSPSTSAWNSVMPLARARRTRGRISSAGCCGGWGTTCRVAKKGGGPGTSIGGPTPESLVRSGGAALHHAAHASRRHGRRGRLLLRLLGHHRLGGEQEPRDR